MLEALEDIELTTAMSMPKLKFIKSPEFIQLKLNFSQN